MTMLYLAQGFRYAGLHCGIRPGPQRRDLALIVSDRPAAAGVFTSLFTQIFSQPGSHKLASPATPCKIKKLRGMPFSQRRGRDSNPWTGVTPSPV